MPKGKPTKTSEAPVNEMPVVMQKPEAVPESVYSAEELANNHKALGTYREIVVVALKLAGKKTATLREAKEIIKNFKK